MEKKSYFKAKKIKQNIFEGIRIKQRKEECHHETTFWDNSGLPICLSGYGITQKEADTKALLNFLVEMRFIKRNRVKLEGLKIF